LEYAPFIEFFCIIYANAAKINYITKDFFCLFSELKENCYLDPILAKKEGFACIPFRLAGDGKKESRNRPVFALVDESHLCGFRT
jgi:hypothetical protein